MVSRVASPALAVCGVRTRPGASSRAGLTSRFAFEHVQRGAADFTDCQRVDQRHFVHHATACGVDQISARLHRAQRDCVDQVTGLGVSGVWTETTSLSASSVGVSTNVTPSSTLPGFRLREVAMTFMSNAWARRATA